MAFPFSGKKDEPGQATSDAPEGLEPLTEGLAQLAGLLDQTRQQMTAYLVHREAAAGRQQAGPPSDRGLEALGGKLDGLAEKLDAVAERFEPLSAKLDGLKARLDAAGETSPGPKQPAGTERSEQIEKLERSLVEHRESISAALRELRQRLDDGVRELAEYVRPQMPDAAADAAPGTAEWQRAILGPSLAENPALEFQRQQLVNGVLEGNAAACALAGQLLVFQSSPAEKMPPLLKDIGEAYYRWQPKTRQGGNKMEEALAAWLRRACEDAGIGNTIELVHPGQRFDAGRHSGDQRGVEITQVRGWVVLRDNGKVYTKASVDVR